MIEAITWAILALSVSVLLAARRLVVAIMAHTSNTTYVRDDVTVIAWALRGVYAVLVLLAIASLIASS